MGTLAWSQRFPPGGTHAVGWSGGARRGGRPHPRRGHLRRNVLLDPSAGGLPNVPYRPTAVAPGLAGNGDRHHRADLLPVVLFTTARQNPRPARRVRRRHAGARERRRLGRSLRFLGADHGLLLPYDRPRLLAAGQPCGGDHSPHRDHDRRPGDAGRHRDLRHPGGHLQSQWDPRRTAPWPSGHCCSAPHARGGLEQVSAGAVPLLASRCDGRPHPRVCLPARGDDGEGRRLPRRSDGTRVRVRAAVAPRDRDPGRRHHDPRWLAGAAPRRSEATAGLRHGQPTRLHHVARRARHPGRRPGGAGDASCPRAVQSHAVPQRRGDRSLHRDARPHQAVRSGQADARSGGDSGSGRRFDGGHPAAVRFLVEGSRAGRLDQAPRLRR